MSEVLLLPVKCPDPAMYGYHRKYDLPQAKDQLITLPVRPFQQVC